MSWVEVWALLKSIETVVGYGIGVLLIGLVLWSTWRDMK